MSDLSPVSTITPAQSDSFAEGLKRTGLTDIIDSRLKQNLASIYIADQFGAWQNRKAVNDEAHSDANARFAGLPQEVQGSVARLAELRLAATAAVFSPAGLAALIEFGQTVTPEKVTILKADLDVAAAKGEKFVIPELESFISQRNPLGTTAGFSYTEILLRIHHGTWHANLDKDHDFAYNEDKLPTNSSTGVISGKDYPPSLKVHSDKADTLNVLSQLAALAATFKGSGTQPLTDMLANQKLDVHMSNKFLTPLWVAVVMHLDDGAVFTNR